MYLVKWEGYRSDENTWEPQSNLKNVKHLIRKFNKVKADFIGTNPDASTCPNELV